MAKVAYAYQPYVARSGDTFDLIASQAYGTARMTHYLMQYNKDYLSVLMFEGGEDLIIPLFTEIETAETMPPWRR